MMCEKIVNQFKHVLKIMKNVKLKSPVSKNNRKYLDCPEHCGSELIGNPTKLSSPLFCVGSINANCP